MRWSQDGSASICCLWLGLIDTSVLSAVSRVHTSILCSNSVYLCYNSCSCHTSVFIFSSFCLNSINVKLFLLLLIWYHIQKSLSVCPPIRGVLGLNRQRVAILCTRCKGFLAIWAVDNTTCDSARSCDKALFLEVVCMFDTRMSECLTVGVCRATLPECWCVMLQHWVGPS